MTLDVHLFPCRSDNYGFLIRDRATGTVAAVDTPDAARILQELDGLGWGRLDLILNTHWHPDHTQGNARLKADTGCEIVGPEEVRKAAPIDRIVVGGDTRWTYVQLWAEAERIARDDYGMSVMRMTVIDVREELIAWYERRGYHRTGIKKPFPYGDERFGIPLRDDLRFEVLEKML